MPVLSKLIVELDGRIDGFVESMRGAEGLVAKSSASLLKAGAGLTAGVTAPILAIGTAALAVGGQYDDAMDNIATTTGATGDVLTGLGDTVSAVFTSIPTDLDTASQAVGELYQRTGQTGQGLADLAAQSVELARLTGGDLGTQIANTTRLFGDWSVAVGDQSQTLDLLFVASQKTGIGVDTLAGRLVQFGAPLRQMGFGLEESAALLAKFEQEGVNSELVMGSLRIALGRMAQAGIEPVEGLNQLINAIQTAGSTGEANALAIDAFGARAGPDMAAAIREGRFEVETLMGALEDAGGAILESASATSDYGERWTVLKNKLIDAAAPLGETMFNAVNNLTPVIEKAIGALTGIIDSFTNLDPSVQTAILAVAGLAAALGPVLAGLGAAMPAITAVGGALGALASGPVVVVVAAIAGLAAAWATDFGGIRTAALEAFEAIQPTLQELANWLQVAIPQAIATASAFWTGTLQPALQQVWQFMQANVVPILQTVFNWLGTVLPPAIQALAAFWTTTLLPAIQAVWQFLDTYVIPLLTSLAQVVFAGLQVVVIAMARVWRETLQPAFKIVWDLLDKKLGPAFRTLGDFLKTVFAPAVDIARGAVSGLAGMFEGLMGWLNKVKDALNGLKDKLLGLDVANVLKPGSPTPFEIGLRGVVDALQAVQDNADIRFTVSGANSLPAVPALAAAGSVAGRRDREPTVINLNMTFSGQQDAQAVARAAELGVRRAAIAAGMI